MRSDLSDIDARPQSVSAAARGRGRARSVGRQRARPAISRPVRRAGCRRRFRRAADHAAPCEDRRPDRHDDAGVRLGPGYPEQRAGGMVSGIHRPAARGQPEAAAPEGAIAPYLGRPSAGLHRDRGALPRGVLGRIADAGHRRLRLPARKTRRHRRHRTRRSRNPRRTCEARPDAARPGAACSGGRATHQAEGFELRTAIRARQLHRRFRRRGPSRSGPTPRRARRLSRPGR